MKSRFFLFPLLLSLLLVVSGCGSFPSQQERDSLAQCVTDAGWTMYGAYRCSHCQSQKQLFGSSFDNIRYIECAEEGTNTQKDVCTIAGVTGYPTWINTDGSVLNGQQSLDDLARAANCPIPLSE